MRDEATSSELKEAAPYFPVRHFATLAIDAFLGTGPNSVRLTDVHCRNARASHGREQPQTDDAAAVTASARRRLA